MISKIKRLFKAWHFNFAVKKVLQLPPVVPVPQSNITIVTQLCGRDILMYLVAIKTFTNYVKPKSVIIISDRLSIKEIAILNSQIANLKVIDIENVYDIRFPKGGCWERLLTILSIVEENEYIIQLDSDTITLKSPDEIIECIKNNRCFILGTLSGQVIVSFSEATQFIKQRAWLDTHVQAAAELVMEEIDNNNNLKYVRGCAGFAGFSSSALKVDRLATICENIELKIGKDKWKQWGSEQVASNIALANSDDPLVLPLDRYDLFQPMRGIMGYSLLHFIGMFRFETNDYRRIAVDKIKQLLN